MKGAFVLQIATDSDAARREFAGHIEEIDTGTELKFRSTDQLLEFLRACVTRLEGQVGHVGQVGQERPRTL
jgi:hypothetical protein